MSERLAVYYDPAMLDFVLPAGAFEAEASPYLAKQIEHPEGPDRLFNTAGILERTELADVVDWKPITPATDDEVLTFHEKEYWFGLVEASDKGLMLSSTTHLPVGGITAIRLNAGAALGAVRSVLSGDFKKAYCLGRPPSHHAAPGVADGYCFVNGLGLAALEALASGMKRIAILDWDVHHGNGTQSGFYHRDDVLTISMHMDHGAWSPTSHPETGKSDEIGTGPGEGFNINLPLPMGSGNDAYLGAMDRCVLPALTKFKPDLILLANGQDANKFDPNGRQCLSMAGFHALATKLRGAADAHCGGKVMMTQEGGYNPAYAPFCAYAVAAGLLGRDMDVPDPLAYYPNEPDRAKVDVDALIAAHPLADRWNMA